MTNKLDWDLLNLPGLTTKQTLTKLYLTDKLSIKATAKHLGINELPLRKKLKELNIPRRPQHRLSFHKDAIITYIKQNPEVTRICDISRGVNKPYSVIAYYKHLLKKEEKV